MIDVDTINESLSLVYDFMLDPSLDKFDETDADVITITMAHVATRNLIKPFDFIKGSKGDFLEHFKVTSKW